MIVLHCSSRDKKKFTLGKSGQEIADILGLRDCLIARLNGKLADMSRPLSESGELELLSWPDESAKQVFWHSSAHLLAEALEALYPGVKFGIGPPIATGFYYDVDFGDRSFSADDLPTVTKKMQSLAKKRAPYVRKEISKKEAITYFEQKGDPYKVELLQDLRDGDITFYTQGGFTDLCRGPHLPHTGHIKAIKLLQVAGAYWRGDTQNKQLTRIYGLSFPTKEELRAYLQILEEAKRRDHRRVGQAMELFTFSSVVGAGLPLWLPKGTVIREQLTSFLAEAQRKAGYQPVITPHIGSKQLYLTSGHFQKYGTDSFQPIETPQHETFLLKPMNCPHHCEIYKSRPRSYKELPLRLSEFGTVYRYEQSGELHGLSRVRGFTQDDAHIFCTTKQVRKEFVGVIQLVQYIFKRLGFSSYRVQISVRDRKASTKYIGKQADWDQAEEDIKAAVADCDLSAEIVEGEAAFYGPKLDFMLKDALQRSWQLGTIQVDYQLPERFELEYIGADNKKHRPVMIHRAPFGSMERFIALLIEHCGGDFPLWLAPVQLALLPITEKVMPYVHHTAKQLEAASIRIHVDERDEKIGRKIRDCELQKIPIMLLIGTQEADNETLSLRVRKKGVLGSYKLPDFLVFFEEQLQAQAKNTSSKDNAPE